MLGPSISHPVKRKWRGSGGTCVHFRELAFSSASHSRQASEQGPFWQPPGQAITSRKFTGILPAAYSFTIAHVLRSMPLICFASSLKPGIFDVASVSTASVTPQLRA